MKNPLIALTLALFLFSCDTGANEDETGPFSLIGAWEASGEYVVEGDQRTYKSTLTFINETQYKQECEYKSKNGTWNLTRKNDGTYTYDNNNITYNNIDYYADGSKLAGPYVYKRPYKFINKDTLETHGMGIDEIYITGVIYKRKN